MVTRALVATLTLALGALAGCDDDEAEPDAGTLVSPPRPSLPPELLEGDWIDVHMHCELDPAAPAPSCDTTWSGPVVSRGRGVLLSLGHWSIGVPEGELPDIDAIYAEAARTSSFARFDSLDCWHDTPYGPGWAEACKADAIAAIEDGALGFKDHAGKQFDGTDFGLFLGRLNRAAGTCTPSPDTSTPNAACMQQPGVIYPALDAEYREVVRFIVAELRVPLVTHLASWNGADTSCWDPLFGALERCALVGRTHQQRFGEWARDTLAPEDRRRIIIAHLGFLVDDPDALTALLDTGVSLDTSRYELGEPGCEARELFARYPTQLVFGTDRRPGAGCNEGSYAFFLHALGGPTDETLTFETCVGERAATGMDLDEPIVPGCPDVPADALSRVLKTNSISMYD